MADKDRVIEVAQSLLSPKKGKDELVSKISMMAYTDWELDELLRLLRSQCFAQIEIMKSEAEKLVKDLPSNNTGLDDSAYAFKQAAPLAYDLKLILKEEYDIVVDVGRVKQVLVDKILSQQ